MKYYIGTILMWVAGVFLAGAFALVMIYISAPEIDVAFVWLMSGFGCFILAAILGAIGMQVHVPKWERDEKRRSHVLGTKENE